MEQFHHQKTPESSHFMCVCTFRSFMSKWAISYGVPKPIGNMHHHLHHQSINRFGSRSPVFSFFLFFHALQHLKFCMFFRSSKCDPFAHLARTQRAVNLISYIRYTTKCVYRKSVGCNCCGTKCHLIGTKFFFSRTVFHCVCFPSASFFFFASISRLWLFRKQHFAKTTNHYPL